MGLDFFRSIVAACRAGQLRQRDARRFVTSFLEAKSKAVSSPSKRDTGQCGHHGLGMLHSPPLGFLILKWGPQRHGTLCLDLLSLARACVLARGSGQSGQPQLVGLVWALRSRSGLTQPGLGQVFGWESSLERVKVRSEVGPKVSSGVQLRQRLTSQVLNTSTPPYHRETLHPWQHHCGHPAR